MWLNNFDYCGCHVLFSGKSSSSRRDRRATRAGTVTSFRWIVGVVALASPPAAITPAVRVRLNAMTANTSQAAFAVNVPDGRCARTLFFRSALTYSITMKCLTKLYRSVRFWGA